MSIWHFFKGTYSFFSKYIKHLQITNLLQLKYNKNTVIKASTNGEMLHIYDAYLFHWFLSPECLFLK